MAERQRIGKSGLLKRLPSQTTFPNQTICTTITSALLHGHGVTDLADRINGTGIKTFTSP